MRAALYARVSLTEERQNPAIQTEALETWARALGADVVATYVDRVSGVKNSRPGLDAMLDDAKRHEFDVVLVVAMDRLTRGGAYRMLHMLNTLREQGVGLRSQREPWLTTEGPMADVLVAVVGAFAQMEREAISERTKATARYLQANGRRVNRYDLWRPPDMAMFEQLLSWGWGTRRLARHYQKSQATIRSYLKRSPRHGALYVVAAGNARRPRGAAKGWRRATWLSPAGAAPG